jgi:hypothetical protein
MIDWHKFIKAGFSNESEVNNALKERQAYKPETEAKEGNLEIKWYKKNELRYYTVVCRCGNNRMLYHENGIRCHICGRFHKHEYFNLISQKAKKASRNEGGKIEQIPQPMKRQYELSIQNRNIRQRRVLATNKLRGFSRVGSG